MSWKSIEHKIKNKSGSYFVSCLEKEEMDYIKAIIIEKYPDLEDREIDEAISSCCKELSAPRKIDVYLKILREKLAL